MKKRLLALMLVAAMLMGMSMTTFAAPERTGTFNKEYTGAILAPSETLSFEVTKKTEGAPELVVGQNDEFAVSELKNEIPFKVTLNTDTEAGIYEYEIKEVKGSTQGVTYDETSVIAVKVLVSLENGTTPSIEEVGVAEVNGTKNDTIVNTYKLGSLDVTKKVEGNLGDKTAEFTVHVTFNATGDVKSPITYKDGEETKTISVEAMADKKETVTITVKDGETVAFTNIPAGVTYTVKEDDKHGLGDDGFDANSAEDTDYTVTYTNENGTVAADAKAVATITNTKEAEINTGIIINNFPYILALAAVALVAVAFMRKRRSF